MAILRERHVYGPQCGPDPDMVTRMPDSATAARYLIACLLDTISDEIGDCPFCNPRWRETRRTHFTVHDDGCPLPYYARLREREEATVGD